jgi:hypothetical protein
MEFHRPAGWRARLVLTVAAVGAVAAIGAGSASAAHVASVVVFPASPNANGWYKVLPQVTVTFANDPGPTHLEGIQSVSCGGPGVSSPGASFPFSFPYQGLSLPIPVNFTAQSPDPGGTFWSCNATYEEQPFICIFGVCFPSGQWLPGPVIGTGGNLRIDLTQPTLAPSVSPNPVPLNGTAIASPNASDALSGIDTALTSCGPVDTSTVGPHTVSCTATDRAGNASTASAHYTVGYVFGGFKSPVDGSGPNTVNSGRAVPLKFTVSDASGVPVTDLTSVSVTAVTAPCDLGSTPDLPSEQPANGGLLNLGGGSYSWVWKTPKSYAGSCKTLRLDLGDGLFHTADFRFVK